MKKSSLVSVIIPCYNYGKYLGQAIESVLAQTYQNLEIIVINDGSTDNTEEVARGYEKAHSKVRYIRQPNLGIVKTRNKALDLAKGEYLIQLDADDWLDANYIEDTLKVAIRTQADIVYTDCKVVGDENGIRNFPEFSLEKLKNGNFIHISCLLKADTAKGFAFDEALGKLTHEDWDFFLNMCINGKTAHKCATAYLNYRIHASARNNQHTSDKDRRNYAKLYIYLMEKYTKTHKSDFDYLSGKLFAGWYVYLEQHLKNLDEELKHNQKAVKLKDDHIRNLESELTAIKNSRGWKVLKKARKIKSKIKS